MIGASEEFHDGRRELGGIRVWDVGGLAAVKGCWQYLGSDDGCLSFFVHG